MFSVTASTPELKELYFDDQVRAMEGGMQHKHLLLRFQCRLDCTSYCTYACRDAELIFVIRKTDTYLGV